jgi:O-antigen/teichoic acid export membrane protein
MIELKSKSIATAKWSLIFQMSQYFLTFFLSIVLARMIDPAEFGLTGLLTIFTLISTTLLTSGLGNALVFNKSSNEDDYTTVFYFNIIVAMGLYIIMFFIAPYIAHFYNDERLILLTRLICLSFVINAFGFIQHTILVIKLDFKTQSLVRIISLAISVISAIILAFNGWGVYSVVAQVLIQAVSSAVIFWWRSDWRPRGKFSKDSFSKLWAFGSKILWSNLFTQLTQNIDNTLIGKIFSPHILGLFIRAKSTKAIPESIFMQTFQSSVFPILTKVNHDPIDFKKKHLQFYKIGVFFIVPLIAIFFFVSADFVAILYGEKWMPSVPYLKIILFSSVPIFLEALFSQTLLGLGDSKLYMKLNMVKRILQLINIPVALFFGLIPYLISSTVISFFELVISVYLTSEKINSSKIYYFKQFLFSILLTLLMSLPFALSHYLYPFANNLLITKLLSLFFAILIYIILLKKIKPDVYDYYLLIIGSFLKKI